MLSNEIFLWRGKMICKLVGRNGKGYDLKLNQLK
jgi:hypothetical protein